MHKTIRFIFMFVAIIFHCNENSEKQSKKNYRTATNVFLLNTYDQKTQTHTVIGNVKSCELFHFVFRFQKNKTVVFNFEMK